MSAIKRTIVEIPKDELKGVESRFSKETKVDMDNIPKKFYELTAQTKQTCFKDTNPIGIYQSVGIAGKKEDQVILENGSVINGAFPSIILKDSFEVVIFVTTLQNSQKLCEAGDNMMSSYFTDSWCSAIIESADIWLQGEIKKNMKKKNLFTTNIWAPGQHNFPIENQRLIFDILKPEEFGVELSDNYMMQPVKSTSGIFGLSHMEDTRNLIPCDYCDLKDTCPSAYSSDCDL